MKEKDNFILDIKRLGINGEGIGFYNRMTTFVENAIPGEGHAVEVTEVKDKMVFAKSLEIKRISKERIIPSCPYYNECGGCNVSHISYDKMLELKRDLVIEAISRYTSLNPRSFEIRKTVPSIEQFGYRNKSQLAIQKIEEDYTVSMLKAKSNRLVPIKECLVQKPLVNQLNQQILKYAKELGISVYLPKFNRGVLRYLVVRVNEADEALVCLICAEKNNKIKDLAKKIIENPKVRSVYESFNYSKKEGTFFGEELNHLEGTPYIVERVGHIQYKIYPNTFFQLNTKQAKNIFDLVLKSCKLSRKERVLDAYCGVGAIGLYLASMAKEVVGIEYNKDAVLAANENAKMNKISNAKFLQGDAAMLLPSMIDKGEVFDVVVVDPPRTGLGSDFIDAILKTKVKKIVYVSCNPATLAKDLEKLCKDYKVNSITPLDMFPQTALVESIVSMTHIESASVKNK
ncbi:MAG: 23S rRNA (uracil(1939)-C(5))-methyltransferase RlmD [Anaeroplasmataceae bacterium]|nr:23S rRNA (uracil(1939)-C(5))-methyltransferase RlmD [Anaeroplasmataceae bacterium]